MKSKTILTVYIIVVLVLVLGVWYLDYPGNFWTGVEAVVVFVTGFIIVFQVSSLIGEKGEREIRGYIYVHENILNHEFNRVVDEGVRIVYASVDMENVKSLFGDVFTALRRLEVTQKFIDKDNLDKEMLYLSHESRLLVMSDAIKNIKHYDKMPLKFMGNMFNDAYKLLDDFDIWRSGYLG